MFETFEFTAAELPEGCTQTGYGYRAGVLNWPLHRDSGGSCASAENPTGTVMALGPQDQHLLRERSKHLPLNAMALGPVDIAVGVGPRDRSGESDEPDAVGRSGLRRQ